MTNRTPDVSPDGDENHTDSASSGAYLEILPETRRTHSNKLIRGENVSNEPGKMAVLVYPGHFTIRATQQLKGDIRKNAGKK